MFSELQLLNLAGYDFACIIYYALTLIDRNSEVCELCFSAICLAKLIYLVKIKENIGFIKFVVMRKRIFFRYFPFSIDNLLHYLALCGTSFVLGQHA